MTTKGGNKGFQFSTMDNVFVASGYRAQSPTVIIVLSLPYLSTPSLHVTIYLRVVDHRPPGFGMVLYRTLPASPGFGMKGIPHTRVPVQTCYRSH